MIYNKMLPYQHPNFDFLGLSSAILKTPLTNPLSNNIPNQAFMLLKDVLSTILTTGWQNP